MRPAKPRTLDPSYMLGTGFVLISLRRNRCGQHDDQATWKTNSGCKQEPVFIETWSSHQWHVQQLLYELCYLYHCLHGSGINSSSWKWGSDRLEPVNTQSTQHDFSGWWNMKWRNMAQHRLWHPRFPARQIPSISKRSYKFCWTHVMSTCLADRRMKHYSDSIINCFTNHQFLELSKKKDPW